MNIKMPLGSLAITIGKNTTIKPNGWIMRFIKSVPTIVFKITYTAFFKVYKCFCYFQSIWNPHIHHALQSYTNLQKLYPIDTKPDVQKYVTHKHDQNCYQEMEIHLLYPQH